MLGKEVFGMRLPEYIQDDPKKSGEQRHEYIRDQMYERIMQDARYAQQFLMHVDSFKAWDKPRKIERVLTQEKKRIFAGAPEDFIASLASLATLEAKIDLLYAANAKIGGEDDFDETSEFSQLCLEKEEMRSRIFKNPNFDAFYAIERWTRTMIIAAKEVGDLQTDDEKVIEAINNIPYFKKNSFSLVPKDVTALRFFPFHVQCTLTPQAFDKFFQESPNAFGFYISNTHFAFIRDLPIITTDSDAMKKVNRLWRTAEHEFGHRLLDATHVLPFVPMVERIEKAMKRYKKALQSPIKLHGDREKKLLLAMFRNAAHNEHDEFLAELNVVRSLKSEQLEHWRWSTSESIARNFSQKTTRAIADVAGIDPELATKLGTLANEVYPRFQKTKRYVIDALLTASRLGAKRTEAKAFVVALALVMPMRSYKHIPRMLERAYKTH